MLRAAWIQRQAGLYWAEYCGLQVVGHTIGSGFPWSSNAPVLHAHGSRHGATWTLPCGRRLVSLQLGDKSHLQRLFLEHFVNSAASPLLRAWGRRKT